MARPVVRIATIGVAIGIAMIILSSAVVRGFQQEVRDLVIGFGSHVRIVAADQGRAQGTAPIDPQTVDYEKILAVSGVRHVQRFGTLPGILQVDDNVKGVVFKGYASDFDSAFFVRRVVDGRLPRFGLDSTAHELMIGEAQARRLGVAINKKVRIYLADPQGGIRPRVFTVTGLYRTGLQEFDDQFVFGDLRQIQQIAGWATTGTPMVGGFEVLLNDYDDLWTASDSIFFATPFDLDVQTIVDQHPELFNWLAMLDLNVELIIALMVFIAIINLASAMLIIMLERARSIGLLKAIGMADRPLVQVFVRLSARIFLRGLFWGNLIGLGLALMQLQTGWIQLDAESYFLSEVPIALEWGRLALIELGVMAVCVGMMAVPALYVARVDPVKALKFD